MQREVEEFLIVNALNAHQWYAFQRDPKNNRKKTVMRSPTVNNFSVVPSCRSQLKQILVDTTDVYKLAAKLSKCTAQKQQSGNQTAKSTKRHVLNVHGAKLWSLIFDIDEIDQI